MTLFMTLFTGAGILAHELGFLAGESTIRPG